MSNRNNQANKQAARERLRAERERQAKKDRLRRQLIVGGASVGVLAIAGGIGVAVATMGGDNAKAATGPLVKPANTSGPKGTTIVVGKADAKNTLDLFEDPRCTYCAAFEQTVGATVEKDIKDGTYDRWALEVSNAFNSVKDVKSTPTIKLNGTVLGPDSLQGKDAPFSVAAFNSAVDKGLKK
ncbi:hypothetical protein XF35_15255 [Streptomyces platensis subsp. clarensis]|nr:hypothetical protein [Streptomyces platensis subsp. clarensis]